MPRRKTKAKRRIKPGTQSQIQRMATRSQTTEKNNDLSPNISSENNDLIVDTDLDYSNNSQEIKVDDYPSILQFSADSFNLSDDQEIDQNNNSHSRFDTSHRDTTLYCYSNCKYGRKYDCDIIQCSTCMSWIHSQCSDAGSEPKAIWNCNRCRSLPDTVDTLSKQLNEVHTVLSELLNKHDAVYDKLFNINNENEKLKNYIKMLNQENYELRIKQYNNLSSESSSCSDTELSSEDERPQRKSSKRKQLNRKLSKIVKSYSTPNSSLQDNKLKSPEVVSVHQSPEVSGNKSRLQNSHKRSIHKSYVLIKKMHNTTTKEHSQTPSQKPQQTQASTSDSEVPHKSQENRTTISSPSQSARTNTGDGRPKLTVFAGSMLRHTSEKLAKCLPQTNTFVYSTSGLRIDFANNQLSKIVTDFTDNDTLLLHIGTNDIVYNDHLELVAKYGKLLDNVRSDSPNCNIIVSAISYSLHEGNGPFNKVIDQFNGALRILCQNYKKCIFQDFNPPAVFEYYHADGLHFNRKGKDHYAESVAKYMQQSHFPLQTVNLRD